MGFNAAWLAKVAFSILLALAMGFAGILYVGSKLLLPADEASELQTLQSIAAQTTAAETAVPPRTDTKGQPDDVESDASTDKAPTAAISKLPSAKQQAREPQRNQASREDLVNDSQRELRLGQQERRRLRAERRRALEDANAAVRERPARTSRQNSRDEPFFPFRF